MSQSENSLRIIIAPAKQMIVDTDTIAPVGTPVFMEKTECIKAFMQGLSYEEAKKLWGCNDALAQQNYERFADMNLTGNLTPAILAYDGIAYKYMAPGVLTDDEFSYVQEHLRILSGFYGVLKPLDGVAAYRLEMQAKAKVGGTKNLYDYWGDSIYREVTREGRVIINLASKEYSKCVEKFLQPGDTYITCVFGELQKGRIVQKGVYAKMSRGEMVRYMAENNITDPEEMKSYDRLGYAYSEELSDEKTMVFVKA